MILDVRIIENDLFEDERGHFRRIFSSTEEDGITSPIFVQTSLSYNRDKGTLRGLHYQSRPSREWKYVSCIQGIIFDVLVDLRSVSPTFGEVQTIELSAKKPFSLLIPPGVAHGFQTLEYESIVHYQMSDRYNPPLSKTLAWNDPSLDIKWPLDATTMSQKDRNEGSAWPVEY
jgi:dTDP-4-dehydrorhamnose 3,5-epimerase